MNAISTVVVCRPAGTFNSPMFMAGSTYPENSGALSREGESISD